MGQPVRAVVTGGGGFLGSRIVAMLLDEGCVVGSFSRRAHASLAARGVVCHAGDLADAAAVRAALSDCDVVFHVAAKVGTWGDRKEYYSANVAGTRNVIDACRRNGVRKLVYTSTPSVVLDGRPVRNEREDARRPAKHLTPYSSTKAEAEGLVLEANGPELATVALRPHVIWGPGDNQVFPRLIARHRARRLRLVGRGDNLVDTTFVDNAARAHLNAARRLAPGSAIAGRAYFISQGDPRSVRSLLNEVFRAAGLPPVDKSIPFPVAYGAAWLLETAYRVLGVRDEPPLTRFSVVHMGRDHYFDISAARRDLDYAPTIGIEEGIEKLRAALSPVPAAAHATTPTT
jgi:nucleoside-diphosphate-sugar epimerase